MEDLKTLMRSGTKIFKRSKKYIFVPDYLELKSIEIRRINFPDRTSLKIKNTFVQEKQKEFPNLEKNIVDYIYKNMQAKCDFSKFEESYKYMANLNNVKIIQPIPYFSTKGELLIVYHVTAFKKNTLVSLKPEYIYQRQCKYLIESEALFYPKNINTSSQPVYLITYKLDKSFLISAQSFSRIAISIIESRVPKDNVITYLKGPYKYPEINSLGEYRAHITNIIINQQEFKNDKIKGNTHDKINTIRARRYINEVIARCRSWVVGKCIKKV